ncbi:MAG TPA: XRE family transcriptional regulator [Bavariicoccus seileri]|uniref:XRE family transcriptional regulator n=1 Tax=Bavariicoccus seileri TaxID=549685 RepID=A0A3D4S5S0_9ENTE|nr:helix-turn-helix transcriptional regulator [Bavariicoccus seileri]HCS93291.1 XRE family transcriptional regulator [Bavariicoccus seileri]
MTIGKQLKKARLDANLTQESLSKRINVSRQTISNWENERSYPDISSIILLSDIYGLSLDLNDS